VKRLWTEGGEALPKAVGLIPDQQPAREKWHALWTRSNCEQRLHDALQAKGFEVFLPKFDVWSRRAGRRRLAPMPMFPGYLFLRRAIDKASYIEVSRTNGLVAILGERWDRLAVVPDPDIAAIQRALRANLPVLPHPFLVAGQRVRIARGPLMDVEGFFVRANPAKGLLVISIDMLHRSVAVEVDCTLVE
jgi:transcription termination/antitermination protein NusG